MAKTKIRKSQKISTNHITDNNSIEELKRTLENGLYIHSSPPKVAGGSGGSKIREHVRAGDIAALEEILLAGNGQSLVNQPSTDKNVRAFLKTVPAYMSKIDLVHDAAERGNLRDLKALLDRRKLSRSRDSKGIGLLHKAVLQGHKDVAEYLISEYPESVDVTDPDGRKPFHYCAASKSPEDMFNFMNDKVPDSQYRDDKGKTASYYMQRPAELGITRGEIMKNGITPTRKRKSPNSKKTSPLHKMKTPPKREGLNITGANIRIWIHDQDLPKLEQIVWEGQGHRLLYETSNNPKVRQFLQLVPKLMTKIKEVHQTSISGDLDALGAKADPPEILLAKDHNGLNPLHRSAALGHMDICEWIVQKNQSSVFGTDKKGRTPLHFSTVPTDGGEIYNLLVRNGADPQHLDHFNKTAEYYRGRPGEIDISIVYDPPSAPRSGGSTIIDTPSSKFPSRSNSGGRQRITVGWINSSGGLSRSLETVSSTPHSNVTPRKKNGGLKKSQSTIFDSLYNRGRKDMVGKRRFVDLSRVTDREIDKMVQEGKVDDLEYVVLSGRGYDLYGKSSWNDNVRRFLKKVPIYQDKVKKLIDAAAEGNIDVVKQLTRENPKYTMARNKDGSVPLHYAAKSGNVEVVQHLLNYYPDGSNVEDQDRRLPVHWAAMSRAPGAHETYDLLERKGSYIHACDVHGRSANDYFREAAESQSQGEEDRPISRNSEIRNSMTAALIPDPEAIVARQSRGRTQSKSPSRIPSISPARNSTLSPPVDPSISPDVGKSKVRARKQSKSPARSPAKSPAKSPTKSPAKSPLKSVAKSPSRSPAKIKAEPINKKTIHKSRSRNPKITKKPSKPDEIQKAIIDAENEDYKAISHIILRGDGNLLVGRNSSNEEVQRFLDELPESLDSINQIQVAVQEGDLRKTTHLIDRREKAYVRDVNGSNILHTAAIGGHSDIVRYLVQTFPDLINQKDNHGRTSLHYAAVLRDGGHTLKILKMANGDPFVKDDSGHTPEDYSTDNELLTQKQLLEELAREKEAKENIYMNKEGSVSPDVEPAEDEQQMEEEDHSKDVEEGDHSKDVEEGDQLKEMEEDDQSKEMEEEDQSKEVEENGATELNEEKEETNEEEEVDDEVKQAIGMAENGDLEGLATIVKNGDGKLLLNKTSSDPEVQEYLDKIPGILASIDGAYKAVENGDTEQAKSLLDKKQKAMVKTNNRANFLHVAVINGHSDIVRFLVQTYPDLLEEEDVNGRTPLHYAAVVRDGGHIYKILKRSQADSTVKDKMGFTPDDYLHDHQLLTQWDLQKELKNEKEEDEERPITKDSTATYYGSEDEGMEKVDPETMVKLEDAFNKLKNSDSKSMLKKHLTQEVFDKIKHRMTVSGATLLDVIKSGVENLDSSIGIYAPDAEAYTLFNELFDPIIEEYHGVQMDNLEYENDYGDSDLFGDLNELGGNLVISTRIRCARSIEGYPLNPKMTLEHYTELEQDVETALDVLDGDLAGYYTQIEQLSDEEAEKLTKEHLLFKMGDRFLESAGACRFWAKGRGIFLNSDNTFCTWVNEEDHMRIISIQEGGDVRQVHDRFVRAVEILESRLPFSRNPKLGNLTFCPTNLGTAIRASVLIRLPKLGQDKETLDHLASQYHLQIRGSSGEHSEAEGNVFDISNKRRLGLNELEAIQDMYEGVEAIIEKELELTEDGGNE